MARKPPAPTVWTAGRQWAGNLIPLLFWLPPTAIGLGQMVVRAEVFPLAVGLVALGLVLGWLATNFAGAAPNRKMRDQLGRILKVKGTPVADDAWFVGFATPKYSSALDPHEDVGFLTFEPGVVRFLSESRTVELSLANAKAVQFRANVHTLVGLGRWVALEGELSGKPVRILLEPRTRPTMVGNLRESTRLRRALSDWLGAGKATQSAQ